jgi:hypothetical protein
MHLRRQPLSAAQLLQHIPLPMIRSSHKVAFMIGELKYMVVCHLIEPVSLHHDEQHTTYKPCSREIPPHYIS